MSKHTLAVSGMAVASGLVAAMLSAAPAQATSSATALALSPAAAAGAGAGAMTTPIYFGAKLVGRNEVPTQDGPAVGDANGKAIAVIRIHGDTVTYSVRWKNIQTPVGFHIHQGEAGANGEVKVPFFGEGLPDTTRAVTGHVKVTDIHLLRAIVHRPRGFYLNLHSKEFPGGAVRAQMYRIKGSVNMSSLLRAGTHASFKVHASGAEEIATPDAKAGAPNAIGQWLIGFKKGKVHWATIWEGIDQVVAGHIHRAPKGQNGPVVVDLIGKTDGLPESVIGLAGVAPIQKDVVKRIKNNPSNWYTNLHTKEFPGGAVRGQLQHHKKRGW
jgi:hypothetical protein